MKVTLISVPSFNKKSNEENNISKYFLFNDNDNSNENISDVDLKNAEYEKLKYYLPNEPYTDNLKEKFNTFDQLYKCLLAIRENTKDKIDQIEVLLFYQDTNPKNTPYTEKEIFLNYNKRLNYRIKCFCEYLYSDIKEDNIIIKHYNSQQKIDFNLAFGDMMNIINQCTSNSDVVYLDLMSGAQEMKKVLYSIGVFNEKCMCIESDKDNINCKSNEQRFKNYEYIYLKRKFDNKQSSNCLTNDEYNKFNKDITDYFLNRKTYKKLKAVNDLKFDNRTNEFDISEEHLQFNTNNKDVFCIDNYNYNFLLDEKLIQSLSTEDKKTIKTIIDAYSHSVSEDDLTIPFLTFNILVKKQIYHLAFGELENVISTALYDFNTNDSGNLLFDLIINIDSYLSSAKNKFDVIPFLEILKKIKYKFNYKLNDNKYSYDKKDYDKDINKIKKINVFLLFSYYILSLHNEKTDEKQQPQVSLHENTFYHLIYDDLKINNISLNIEETTILDNKKQILDEIMNMNNNDLYFSLLEKNAALIYNIKLYRLVRNQFVHSKCNDDTIINILDDNGRMIFKKYLSNLNKYLNYNLETNAYNKYKASDLLNDITNIYFKYYKNIDEYNIELKEMLSSNSYKKDMETISNANNNYTILVSFFTDKCPYALGLYGPTFEMLRYCYENNISVDKLLLLVSKEYRQNDDSEIKELIDNELNNLNELYKFRPKVIYQNFDVDKDKYSVDSCFKVLYDLFNSKLINYKTVYLDTTSGMPEMAISLSLLRFLDSKCKGLVCSADINSFTETYTPDEEPKPAITRNSGDDKKRAFPFGKITEFNKSFKFVNLFSESREAIKRYDLVFLKQVSQYLNNEIQSTIDYLYLIYNYDFESLLVSNDNILDKKLICYINNLLILSEYENYNAFYLQCGMVIERIVKYHLFKNKEYFKNEKEIKNNCEFNYITSNNCKDYEMLAIGGKNKWSNHLNLLFDLMKSSKEYKIDQDQIELLKNVYDDRNQYIHKFTTNNKDENEENKASRVKRFEKIREFLINYAKSINREYYDEISKSTKNKFKEIKDYFKV